MGRAYAEKSLNENLAPLLRFLRRRVGRPWDRVYAEITERVSGDSAVQRHILEHVFDFVERNVRTIDGVLCHSAQWLGVRPLESRALYVCPRTGYLRQAPQRPRLAVETRDPRFRHIAPNVYWMQRTAGWFEVRLAPLPPYPPWNAPPCPVVDRLSGAAVHSREARAFAATHALPWTYTHYAVSVRQLNKREIRAYFQKR